MKNKLFLIIFILIISANLKAQSAFTATGGEAKGNGGTVSYSIGQVVNSSFKGSNGSVNQGTQQPYEILTLGIIEDKNITLTCAAYPNPTSTFLNLRITDMQLDGLSFQLYDLAGKLLMNCLISNEITSIPLLTFSSAQYILRVTGKDKELTTFKVIKN